MSIFVPCPACARHVATTETTCPFCANALPTDLESKAIPGTSRRLGRAAMFTFATTVTILGAVASCDNGSDDSAYGCPATDDTCASPDGSVNDAGGAQPLYGLADATFVEDSGSPDDAAIDDSGDAGEDAD